jgi:hypothetical protein
MYIYAHIRCVHVKGTKRAVYCGLYSGLAQTLCPLEQESHAQLGQRLPRELQHPSEGISYGI